MKICVVGAGVSGLVVLKELLDEGHEAVCFEQEEREGGVFNHPKGIAYDSMLLTVSQYFMSYSSLPPIEEERRAYWTCQRYARYLREFAEKFGLFEQIEFNTKVTGIEPLDDERIRVNYQQEAQLQSDEFDAVAICRGAFRLDTPRLPDIPDLSRFTGKWIHSGMYKSPEPFKGLRVLCVGIGETSSDVTSQISEVAASCTLSMRSYPELRQRYPATGDTIDAASNRFWHWLPLTIRDRLRKHKTPKEQPPSARAHMVKEWSRKSGGYKSTQKNDDFIDYVLDGRIRVLAPSTIERLEGRMVIFEDGTTMEVDVIVFCTGYKESAIPPGWLGGVQIPDVRQLYKHAFHPSLGSRVAFVGWARPRQGGFPVCSEMVARYFSLLCSGKRKLPPEDEMRQVIAEDCSREDEWFANAKYVRTLVHYTRYMDDMAELIGCLPNLEDYLDSPELLFHLVFGSNLAITYRLCGPHATPDLARRVITSLPVHPRFSNDILDAILEISLLQKLETALAKSVSAAIREYLGLPETWSKQRSDALFRDEFGDDIRAAERLLVRQESDMRQSNVC